jgi:hypothetical protein
MANYRYTAPEYMRYSNPPRPAVCQAESAAHSSHALAMAYVPWQEWNSIYDADKGLHCGTIFEDLYKPFCRSGGCS